MRWLEIITLRSPERTKRERVDTLIAGMRRSDGLADGPSHLIEIRTFYHSVVETDLSIHIYWEADEESQYESPLSQRISSALRTMGLLNHSAWIERSTRKFSQQLGRRTQRGNRRLAVGESIKPITEPGKVTMKTKKEEVQIKLAELEARLKDWGADIEKFRTKAETAKGRAKTELHEEVASLKLRMNETKQKLDELKKLGSSASGELKQGLGDAHAKLRDAVDRARAKFN